MRRTSAILVLALGASCLTPVLPALQARDHGAMGQTWGIEEPDLIATIQGRLQTLQANGGIERLQKQLVAKATERVRRPMPVAGITPATSARTWNHDPSIVVDNDIRDHKGNLIAAAGTRVNPLEFIQLNQDLVFVDGDSPAELAWATARYPASQKAKIIFVSGSPLDRMKQYQRRFFFDQRGQLTAKFGIAHTPAVVRASGKLLAIEEVVVSARRGSGGGAAS
ncbi:MAG: type-F conjugative transfer system protein TraW [Luteibacter sp.]